MRVFRILMASVLLALISSEAYAQVGGNTGIGPGQRQTCTTICNGTGSSRVCTTTCY